jgi:hypothetical protein
VSKAPGTATRQHQSDSVTGQESSRARDVIDIPHIVQAATLLALEPISGNAGPIPGTMHKHDFRYPRLIGTALHALQCLPRLGLARSAGHE